MRVSFLGLVMLSLTVVNVGCNDLMASESQEIVPYNGSMTIFEAAANPMAVGELAAILASGVDVNEADSEGMTALHRAAQADNGEAIVLLIHSNADATAVDAQGRTAEVLAEQEHKMNALRGFERAI